MTKPATAQMTQWLWLFHNSFALFLMFSILSPCYVLKKLYTPPMALATISSTQTAPLPLLMSALRHLVSALSSFISLTRKSILTSVADFLGINSSSLVG
jgi:hypothetical protein